MMTSNYEMIPFRWELYSHRREKTEHGRAPKWGAKPNRNDAFLARRGKGKPIRYGLNR